MRVKFNVNLGQRDALALSAEGHSLNVEECVLGKSVDLKPETVEAIRKRCGDGTVTEEKAASEKK